MNWFQKCWHEVVGWSQIIGVRDRLRCPFCKSVGTFKPHGGWFDFADSRRVRRWLCKWCGEYIGPEGTKKCIVNKEKGYWDFPENCEGKTPQEILDHYCNPWAG